MLLKQAAFLYEKHEAGRPQPFNVFSVLRSASDEVNLHSRFLHALLDYKRPGDETRENLADFLRHVGLGSFEQRGVEVRREQDNIDILITNNARPRQAVVVENKIRSGDRPEQLQRYHGVLMDKGYDSNEIKLLYLTPHGDDPSEDSVGNLPYETISYRDTLPPWLERCQQRAYDEPGLRESVAQYRELVQKLTGTDFGEAYMNALTELCLEAQGENLLLVHDLHESMIEAQIRLLKKLWFEIDTTLRKEIDGLPNKDTDTSDISLERIRRFVTYSKNYKYHGLYYPFPRCQNAGLGVEVETSLYFGVYCDKKHQNERAKLDKVLQNVGKESWRNDWWPWAHWADCELNLKYPTRENLELLLNEERRQSYAQGIAQGLKPVMGDDQGETSLRRHTWNA